MPKLPRLKPQEAETLLLNAGFELIRTRGSHKIYKKGNKRKVKDLTQLLFEDFRKIIFCHFQISQDL